MTSMQSTNSPPNPPDQTRGPVVLAVDWLTLGIAITIVLLRFYVRLKRSAHGWDDYTIYSALIICIFGAAANTKQVHLGFGRHVNYIEQTLSEASKWTTISEIQTNLATGLIKISVCLFILRIIKGTYKMLSRIIISFMVVMTLGTLALTFVICFQCIPLKKVWKQDVQGHCINSAILANVNKGLGAFICFTDLFCSFIPVVIFRRLQMKKETKIALCLVMGLGVFTAACSIGQIVTTEFVSEDITWDLVPVEIWTLLQENLGVTAASLPTLRPLLAGLKKFKTWQSDRRQYQRQNDMGGKSSSTKALQGVNVQQTSCETMESDVVELMPAKVIGVERSIDVDFAPRSGGEVAQAHFWEHEGV